MTSGPPLVSVIVPAYNAAHFIDATLESVLAQTYSHLEVLVVDDGSSDETSRIAEDWSRRDDRVRCWRQKNAGVGAARNFAISQALGLFLAPIDADDVWHPEKIALQIAEMERGGDSLGFVYCWSEAVDFQGKMTHRYPICTATGSVLQRHVFRNFLHNASVPLFRASALRAVGGYATRAEQGGGQGCEDWDLTLRIAERFQVGVVAQYLVGYREVPSGMSSGGTGMARSFAYLQSGLKKRNPALSPNLLRWADGFFHLYLARKCHRSGRYREALQYLQLALRADPVVAVTPHFWRVILGCCFRICWPPAPAGPDPELPEVSMEEPQALGGSVNLSLLVWYVFACIENNRWTRLTLNELPQ